MKRIRDEKSNSDGRFNFDNVRFLHRTRLSSQPTGIKHTDQDHRSLGEKNDALSAQAASKPVHTAIQLLAANPISTASFSTGQQLKFRHHSRAKRITFTSVRATRHGKAPVGHRRVKPVPLIEDSRSLLEKLSEYNRSHSVDHLQNTQRKQRHKCPRNEMKTTKRSKSTVHLDIVDQTHRSKRRK